MKKYYYAQHNHQTYLTIQFNYFLKLLVLWGTYLHYSTTDTTYDRFADYRHDNLTNSISQSYDIPWSKINIALNYITAKMSTRFPQIKYVRKKIKKLMYKGYARVAMLPTDADEVIEAISEILISDTPSSISNELLKEIVCDVSDPNKEICLDDSFVVLSRCSNRIMGFQSVFSNLRLYDIIVKSSFIHHVVNFCLGGKKDARK